MNKKAIAITVGALLIAAAAFATVKFILPSKDKPVDDVPDNTPPPPPAPAPTTSPRTTPTNEPQRTVITTPAPTPAPTTNSTGFNAGDNVWVNKNAVALYTYPANKAEYMLRWKRLATGWSLTPIEEYIPQFNLSVNPLGKFIEPATAGWAKIKVAAPNNLNSGGNYFVPIANLKKTAY